VPAQRRVNLLVEDVRAPCAARGERAAHDRARGALRSAARVEIDGHDLGVGARARIEQHDDLARAPEEGCRAVGGAGQVIGEDEDATQ
jgi:hypothetical protein